MVVASDPELREWFSSVRPLMAAAYMDALERGAEVRVGSGNVRELVPVNGLKGYWVGHSISAGGDPHLHNHLIISATAKTIDGRRGQIDGKKLLRETAKLADASARRVLMEEAAKVGLKFGLDGELLGVDFEVIERASTGRNAVQAIQSYYAAEGTPISDTQAWHHWRQIAEGKEDKGLSKSLVASIRASRGAEIGGEAIEHALDAAMADAERAKVVGAWLAGKYGISWEEWEGLSGLARAAAKVEPDYDNVTRVVALMATLSYAPKPEVVAALCARVADDAARPALLAQVAADPRILVGDKHWVLRSQLEREEVVAARATKLIAGARSDLGIDELLGDTDGAALVVISGVAGGGKSSALANAKAKWSAKGVTVWATARNRLTATETGLAAGTEEGDSLSTAALRQRIALRSWNTPMPGDVLVVDEWGLLDAGDVDMILSLAESGVQVKALGDAHQIQPIDGSTDARIVMDLAKRQGMPSLDESFRAAEWKDLHDLLRAVAVGDCDPEAVLGHLDVRVASSAEEAVGIAQSSPDAEIVVRSNDLRCEVAEALSRPEMPISWRTGKPNIAMLRDGIAGWAGDQVVVRKNVVGKVSRGEVWGSTRLTNGEKGRIIGVGQKIVVVAIGDKSITISREVAREALALGGVQTGDSAQGQTWERAVVVLSGLETREWLYSTATRGRQAPIFVALADSDEAAALVVSGVLSREGMAQTVVEMARTDATLAASVRRAGVGDGGDAGGFADLAEALGETQASTTQETLCNTAADAVEAGADGKSEFGAIVASTSAESNAESDPKGQAGSVLNSPFGDMFLGVEPERTGEDTKKRYADVIWGTWDDAPSAEPAGLLDDTSAVVGNPENAIAPEVASDGAAEIASAGESAGAESPKVAAREPLSTRAKNFPGRRKYQCGFYYKTAAGVWCADEKERQELIYEVRDRIGPLGHLSDEREAKFFDITVPKQLGPKDWYTPSAELLARVEARKAEDVQRARGTYRPSGGKGSGSGKGSGDGSSQGHSGGYGYGLR